MFFFLAPVSRWRLNIWSCVQQTSHFKLRFGGLIFSLRFMWFLAILINSVDVNQQKCTFDGSSDAQRVNVSALIRIMYQSICIANENLAKICHHLDCSKFCHLYSFNEYLTFVQLYRSLQKSNLTKVDFFFLHVTLESYSDFYLSYRSMVCFFSCVYIFVLVVLHSNFH